MEVLSAFYLCAVSSAQRDGLLCTTAPNLVFWEGNKNEGYEAGCASFTASLDYGKAGE